MKNLFVEITGDSFRYGYSIANRNKSSFESFDMLGVAMERLDVNDIKHIEVSLTSDLICKIKSRIQDVPIGENVWGYSGVTLNKTLLRVGQYHRNIKLTEKSNKILSYAYFPSLLMNINTRPDVEAFPECIHELILGTGPLHYMHNLTSNITLDSEQIKTLFMLLSSSDETNKAMGIPYLFMMNQPNYRNLFRFILETNYNDINLIKNSDSDLLLDIHSHFTDEYGPGYKAIKDFNESEQDLGRELVIKYLTRNGVLDYN